MPEWARVLAGCIVLMIIEAGAPVLVIESLHLRQNRQPEVHRAAKQETSGPADQNKNSDATNNPANQSVAIVPPIATQDKQKERDDQRNGREQKSDSFSALGYEFKITDFLVSVFTGLLVLVGFIQYVMLHRTMIVTRLAAKAARDSADALPNLERAYIFIEINPHVAEPIRQVLFDIATKTEYKDGRFGLPADVGHQFINHGKTPAIIKEITSELNDGADLPSEIRYIDEPLPQEIVVRAGDIYPEPAKNLQLAVPELMPKYSWHQRKQLTRDELKFNTAESIRAGRSFLWFYGHVVYKDVFGKSHETRFCWRYSWPNTFEQYNREGEDLNGRT